MAFYPITIYEAVEWLDKENIKDVTVKELLRLGYGGHLQVCLPLSERAYSPTKRVELENSNFDAGIDMSSEKEHELAHEELYGVYVLPSRTLFELEAFGKAKTGLVLSLDGKHFFSVEKDIVLEDLRITSQALESLLIRCERRDSNSDNLQNTQTPMQRQRFQESEILRVIKELGYDAQNLPQVKLGSKEDVKSLVRNQLKNNDFLGTVFNKAWERLASNNDIKRI